MGYFRQAYALPALGNVCSAPPKRSHRLYPICPVCLCFLGSTSLSPKQGHPHTQTPHSPKVTAESQTFPVTGKHNKDWSSSLSSRSSLPFGARPPPNSLHVQQGEGVQSERGKRCVFTDLGSSVLRASCFLFLPPLAAEI